MWCLCLVRGVIGVIYYRDNGKENGNYYYGFELLIFALQEISGVNTILEEAKP